MLLKPGKHRNRILLFLFYLGATSTLYLSPLLIHADSITTNSSGSEASVNAKDSDSLDTRLSDIFNSIKKSVVLIELVEIEPNPHIFVNQTQDYRIIRSFGSGFVYDVNGSIVTNAHVVYHPGRNRDSITVSTLDGTSYEATVKGVDRYSDLAVLSLTSRGYLPDAPVFSHHTSKGGFSNINTTVYSPLPLANSSDVTVGQQVIAIGNPEGLTGSMSRGIVSQLNRIIEDLYERRYFMTGLIQTDAVITHGSSGGPLLNLNGEVIGVNTRQQFSEGNEVQGLSFAIPSNTVRKIIPVLLKNGTFDHPWLGVHVLDITADLARNLDLPANHRGVIVVDVTEGGPASKAGITEGTRAIKVKFKQFNSDADIIMMIDQTPVRTRSDLINYVDTKCPGNIVNLKIWRTGNFTYVPVVLEKRSIPGQNMTSISCS